MVRRSVWRAAAVGALAVALSGCETVINGQNPVLADQDVRLTIIHTSDIHSRLIPYAYTPGLYDQSLGLDAIRSLYGIGGIERLGYVVARERQRSARVIYLDSGDVFQGAPMFNIFQGEPEMRVLSEMRPDAVALGNHEFDSGAMNLAAQIQKWRTYPLLADNYLFEDPSRPWTDTMNANVAPATILNVEGLKVGVIGIGNLSAMDSLVYQGNGLGITPVDPIQATQYWVDILRPVVDLIVVTSHQGLSEDENLAESVRGIDVIMGGHLHIVLEPPVVVPDPDGRPVVIQHSGAFAKFVGRLDLVLRKPSDPVQASLYPFDVASYKYTLFPIDNAIDTEVNASGHDPAQNAGVDMLTDIQNILEPYQEKLAQTLDLKRTVSCAIDPDIKRYGSVGGDSQVGNLTAEAIQYEPRVLADFGVTNTLGIRDDLRGLSYGTAATITVNQSGFDPGVKCTDPRNPLNTIFSIALEQLYNVLPFENTITTMYMSGPEVQELLDYNAARSQLRGCQTQIQVSGMTFTLVCNGDQFGSYPHAENVTIGGQPLNYNATYKLATNNYIAGGGSGFLVLKHNTTQVNTGISMRQAVIEYMANFPAIPCTNTPNTPSTVAGVNYPPCPATFDHVGLEDGRISVQY